MRNVFGSRRGLGAAVAALVMAATVGLTGLPAAADTPPPGGLAVIPTTAAGSGAYIRNGVKTTLSVPVGAQAFAGKFSSAAGADIFVYNPGRGADFIVRFTTGVPASTVVTPVSVSGTYTPIVGDFDGNGIDDIFWYAPGSTTDRLWLFNGASGHSDIAVGVGGTYQPAVIDANGDGRDDIIWYSPTGSDGLWLFGPGALTHTSKSLTIGPGYQIVVGHFGVPAVGQPADRAVFYNPAGADYFWTFDASANHSSALLPSIDGNYQLLPGQFFEETYGGLVFYGPGSLPEQEWAFGPGKGGDVSPEADIPAINGTYATQTGDFDGNGYTDIAFVTGTQVTIWSFTDAGTHTQKTFTGLPAGALVRAVTVH